MTHQKICDLAQAIDTFLEEKTDSDLLALAALIEVTTKRAAFCKKDTITKEDFSTSFTKTINTSLQNAFRTWEKAYAAYNTEQN